MQAKIIAHRGFSGRYPENTLAAVRAALRLGVDMVEIDVQETRDGKLAVFHDFRLDRLCGVRGRVRDVTFAEMRRHNPAVPTLRQVLRACRDRAQVLVEIKRADPGKVAAEIAAAGMEQQVIVFALSVKRLAAFAAANPQIPRFALVARQLPARLPVTVRGVGASKRLIKSRAEVRRLHRRGWRLFVWTVNRPSDMARLLAWGVDGLITNHPDRALRLRGRK